MIGSVALQIAFSSVLFGATPPQSVGGDSDAPTEPAMVRPFVAAGIGVFEFGYLATGLSIARFLELEVRCALVQNLLFGIGATGRFELFQNDSHAHSLHFGVDLMSNTATPTGFQSTNSFEQTTHYASPKIGYGLTFSDGVIFRASGGVAIDPGLLFPILQVSVGYQF